MALKLLIHSLLILDLINEKITFLPGMVITLPNLANYFMQRNLTTSQINKAPFHKPDQNIVRALKLKQNVDDRFGRVISLKCDCHPIKKRWNV